MGFVTYLLLAAIAAAGSLIDVFGGFSLAQGFDPLSMNPNTVFGKFHQMLATVLLFVTGGHLLVIGGLLQHLPLPAARHDARLGAAHRTCWSRRSACSSSPRCRSRCR